MARRGNTLQDTFQNVVPTAIQNNFIGGLKTEFTGLNFPPNACTDVENTVFSIVGDVLRREGIDFEDNFVYNTIDRTNKAISSFRWLNAGGDGSTQIYVLQVGANLYFFVSSSSTIANPLSTQIITSTVNLSTYLAVGSSNIPDQVECEYTAGNGYLFIFHPYLDPIYCTYSAGSVSPNSIIVQTRDFNAITEPGIPVNLRPTSLTAEHQYNLQNQGWTTAPPWSAVSSTDIGDWTGIHSSVIPIATLGNNTFTVIAGILGITGGTPVGITSHVTATNQEGGTVVGDLSAQGVVISYSGTSLVIDITSWFWITPPDGSFPIEGDPSPHSEQWIFFPAASTGYINTWHSDIGNYPSNSDVWWTFKDSTDVFNPTATLSNITLSSGPAPQGSYVLNEFNQTRATKSGIIGLTDVTTFIRPKTGAWFQGRVFYTGVDDAQASLGDQLYYTWSENIYFSQIVTNTQDFGSCYQLNDPTSETLFDLLPSDGGVIKIQGSGSIYKLFPVQNGLIVFAANGIWFITGSTGIGFAANDYTITKISAVESISCTPYVDVLGFPVFWNEEGIYALASAQQGLGLTVEPITVGTIKSFYDAIPKDSKKFARGSYNPIDYVIEWVYRSTQETDVTSRYQFDAVLNLNMHNKAFYPYSLNTTGTTPYIHDVTYIASPGGGTAPDPTFKYLCSVSNAGSYSFTFAEERDTTYTDWVSFNTVGFDFSSYFVTGYTLDGQGLRKFQPEYILMYSRNTIPTSYKIQGIWDFAISGNSGKYSGIQLININKPYFGMAFRRHRIRGHGLALQFKVSSVKGQPFDIMGWSALTTQNAGL